MRLRCHLEVLLWVDDDLHFATVIDVTLSGLCLVVEKALRVDQAISLARDDFGRPWQGKVIWCKPKRKGRGYHVGVGYPADPDMLRASWLQPALKQTGFEVDRPDEKRRLLRISGRVACQLKGLTGETYAQAEMLDLSVGGALVESAMQFPSNLSIEFETSPLGGLPPLRGLAKIVCCRQSELTGLWRSGLRFTESKVDDVRKYMGSMLASQ